MPASCHATRVVLAPHIYKAVSFQTTAKPAYRQKNNTQSTFRPVLQYRPTRGVARANQANRQTKPAQMPKAPWIGRTLLTLFKSQQNPCCLSHSKPGLEPESGPLTTRHASSTACTTCARNPVLYNPACIPYTSTHTCATNYLLHRACRHMMPPSIPGHTLLKNSKRFCRRYLPQFYISDTSSNHNIYYIPVAAVTGLLIIFRMELSVCLLQLRLPTFHAAGCAG